MVVEGVAAQPDTQREGTSAVLRFVLEADTGSRLPVEMRGRELRGLLNEGDRIRIDKRRLTDRDGVARPKRIMNLTTNSQVQVRHVRARRSFGAMFKLASSAASGVLTWIITSATLEMSTDIRPVVLSFDGSEDGAGTDAASYLPILAGVLVALVVFLVVWRAGRRR